MIASNTAGLSRLAKAACAHPRDGLRRESADRQVDEAGLKRLAARRAQQRRNVEHDARRAAILLRGLGIAVGYKS
jgi:hypothetical protein